MNNQFQLHRILIPLGLFLLGYQTMNINFQNFSWESQKANLIFLGLGLVLLLLGMYFQKKSL